jgi:hypothetical protein
MKVEVRKNGELQILLTPGDTIDLAVLNSMLAKTQLGRHVKMARQEAEFVLSMEAE